MSATKEEVKAVLNIIQVIANTIKAVGRVPSGHLYTQLMSEISLETYTRIIAILTDAKLVKVVNHEIIWTAKEPS